MQKSPTFASLSGKMGAQFTLGIGTPNIQSAPEVLEISRFANFSTGSFDGGDISVTEDSTNGSGVWVPYMPKSVTYGFSTGASSWMATGPFSGCHIAFFTMGGRVGLAHIPQPPLTDTIEEAWHSFRSAKNGVGLLREWKVPIPDQTKFSCSHLFFDLHSGNLTQVDVHVRTMGASDGRIFSIKKIV